MDDWQIQVAHYVGKSQEYLRRIDRADNTILELNVHIKSKEIMEEDKDSRIKQLDEKIDRLKRCVISGDEIVKIKEDTIMTNNNNIEAKEIEINKLRIELNQSMSKQKSKYKVARC